MKFVLVNHLKLECRLLVLNYCITVSVNNIYYNLDIPNILFFVIWTKKKMYVYTNIIHKDSSFLLVLCVIICVNHNISPLFEFNFFFLDQALSCLYMYIQWIFCKLWYFPKISRMDKPAMCMISTCHKII